MSRELESLSPDLAGRAAGWAAARAGLPAAEYMAVAGDLQRTASRALPARDAVSLCRAAKVLMGTDWPPGDFVLERLTMQRSVPDAAARRLVEGENMARLLSLS